MVSDGDETVAQAMADETLGQRIADTVMTTFHDITSKAGKPGIRSNGVKEWTVLSAMVMIIHDDIIPLCITTGVKALPDNIRRYSQGKVVHDMHAEILAIRSLNRYLIDACQRSSPYIMAGDKYKFIPEVKLALFITEPPCGDASMNYMIRATADNKPWEIDGDEPATKKPKVMRGRSYFDQLGRVRTKPGRSDAVVTLSKSCSDKLCLKQLVGLNNCITSEFFAPIFLDYLVLRDDKINHQDIQRCFDDRFNLASHSMKLLSYAHDSYPYHKSPEAVPSPNSLIYIDGDVHVLNNGVKIGSYIKRKPPKPCGESILCNYKMMHDSLPLINTTATTYEEFKHHQHHRQRLKSQGKEVLKNWQATTKDNFSINI